MRRLRLAVVVTHPIQYHACRWRALAKQPDIDLEVLYCSDRRQRHSFSEALQTSFSWDVDLLDGYKKSFFPNYPIREDGLFGFVNPTLWAKIAREDYDSVYFHGNLYVTHLIGMMIAKMRRRRIVMQSICYDLDERSAAKRRIRSLIYRTLYKLPDRIVYIGRHNLAHYKRSGVPGRKLIKGPHPVDNDFFQQQRSCRVDQEHSIRREFGIGAGQKVILFCAKMFSKKAPGMLLEAYFRARLGANWVLLMVGDGRDRESLQRAARMRVDPQVKFTGFLNQSEISKAYAIADVHVLPSQYGETWGLVVNESLNFGVPQIVSDMVGCAPDLVEGKTGEVFPHKDQGALVSLLRSLETDPERWDRYRAAAEPTVRQFGPEQFVDAVREALDLPARQSTTSRKAA